MPTNQNANPLDELQDQFRDREFIVGAVFQNHDSISEYAEHTDKIVNQQKAEEILAEIDLYRGGPVLMPCPEMTIWTTDRVFFVEFYDGTRRFTSVPRHPSEDFEPEYVGGG